MTDPESPITCDHCGATHPIMVQMQPGKDGKPWWLCVRDWRDGLQPMKCGLVPAKYREAA